MKAGAGSVSQFTHASPHTGACVFPITFPSALEQILAQQSCPSPSEAGLLPRLCKGPEVAAQRVGGPERASWYHLLGAVAAPCVRTVPKAAMLQGGRRPPGTCPRQHRRQSCRRSLPGSFFLVNH